MSTSPSPATSPESPGSSRINLLRRVVKALVYGDWLIWNPGEDEVVQWNAPYELRKLTVIWQRIPSTGVAQDAAMTTHHFLNLTEGAPDASWTAADFSAVETAFDTLWNGIKTLYSPGVTLTEYAWRKDGPAFRPFGTQLSPTVRRVSRNLPGTAAGTNLQLPPQCAISVTEVTAAKYIAEDVEGSGDQLRNRWGRFYLPAPTALVLDAGGRLSLATQTPVADKVLTFYNACVAAGLIPVMYSPTTGSSWSVDEIRVDDIVDVIRSRRYRTPISRQPRSVNAP